MNHSIYIWLLGLCIVISACEKHPWKEFDRINSSLPNANLRAQFNINDNACLVPCDPMFENTSINALEYEWYFGNGDNATDENPSYVYEQPGVYEVMLIAKNFALADTAIQSLIIQDEALLPIANFDVDNNNCLVPCNPMLINSSINTDSIRWDLGNGLSSNLDEPGQIYDLPGDYEVKLLAYGNNAVDSITKTISIIAPITFEKTYLVDPNNRYVGGAVLQLEDDGYMITGYNSSDNASYMLRVDDSGNTQIDKHYGNGGAYSLTTLNAQEYLITGFNLNLTQGFGTAYILRVNGIFDQLQAFSFDQGGDRFYTVAKQASNNELLMGGRIGTTSQVTAAILRMDANFNTDTILYTDYTQVFDLIITSDNRCSFICRNEAQQLFLVKTNADYSSIAWVLPLPTYQIPDLKDSDHLLIEDDNGDYIIVGYAPSGNLGQQDATLIKVSSNGQQRWQKYYGGALNDQGASVQNTADGGLILLGSTESFSSGGKDVYLVKTDEEGAVLWERTYGGLDIDFGTSVKQTRDGGFILTGGTQKNEVGGIRDQIYLIKTASNGQIYE
ncbi:MAG: PKD domain-containing protein [Bacteroidota bacterium]